MPFAAPRWLPSIVIAVPLGILATAAAVLGAAVDPLLPILASGAALIVALGYARPLWIIYLGVLALPLEFELQELGLFDLTPTKALLLLGVTGWVTAQIIHRRPLVAGSSLTLPLVALIVVILPGLIVADDKLVVFNQLAIWVAWFCLFQVVVQDDDETSVRRVLIALAIAGVGLGMLAITDGTFQGDSSRADAGFGSPNALATLMLSTILPAICLCFSGPTWKRAAFALAAAVGGYGLLLTQSRGGFLGLAAGLIVLVSWRPIRRAAIVGIIVIGGLAFGGLNPLGGFLDETGVGERIASITTAASTDPRLPLYRRTVEVIEDQPIFGVGTNDFRSASIEYGILASGGPEIHAHNAPLTIAAERGVIGLAAFAFFAFALTRLLTRGLTQAKGERRAMLTGVMAVFVAAAAHNLVDYTLNSVLLGVLFVLAGCATVLSRRASEDSAAADEEGSAERRLAVASES